MEKLELTVPSSFVKGPNKLITDRGSGEAKLYSGSIKLEDDLDTFFQNWHPLNTYELVPENLILYLQDVQKEFSKQSLYRSVNKKRYGLLLKKIDECTNFKISLTKHTDSSRTYIRCSSKSSRSAWNLLREILFPLISMVSIERSDSHIDGSADYLILLVKKDAPSKKSPLSGIIHKTPKPEMGRKISQSLKDLVWKRDQGICQANWRLDSKFEKTTGEICGSNEFLEFDHIVPFSKGGRSTYRNLQLLCRHHNRMKSDKDI